MLINDVIIVEDKTHDQHIADLVDSMVEYAKAQEYEAVFEELSYILDSLNIPNYIFFEKYGDILQGLKPAIIKSLLVTINLDSEELSNYDFENVIKWLQQHMKWPEIATIVKAYDYMKQEQSLTESEESDELVAEFLGYLDQQNYWEAFDKLISAYDANRDCLQSWWRSVDMEKPAVLKGLLHVIKNDPDLPVDAIIDDLHTDLKWPELLTIKKALQHNKQPVAEDNDDEESNPSIDHILAMLEDLKDNLWDGLDYLKDYGLKITSDPDIYDWWQDKRFALGKSIVHDILNGYSPKYMIQDLVIAGFRLPDDEIRRGVESMDRQITHELETLDVNGEIIPLLKIISNLMTLDAEPNWSLDAQELTERKQEIVKSFLVIVKRQDRDDLADIIPCINVLKSWGVKWPELLTIKKALQHNKQLVAEDSAVERLTHIIDMIYSADSYHEVCLYAADLVDAGFTSIYPNLQIPKFMAEHKQGIIHAVLQMIKSNAQYDPDPALVVKGLKMLGADYQEFATIEAAIQQGMTDSVTEAFDPEADPVIGYVKEMYSDLKSGYAGMIVLQLRDYVYDTGSPENLAQSIREIEPELPALINQHKTEIVKNMLEIVKKDLDHSLNVLLPVFQVLHHLGIDWPEIARIKAGITQGFKSEPVSEDDELSVGRQQLQRMAANHIISAIQNRRWMSLLDTTQTIEQEKWNLDSRYGFPEKLAQYKTDVIKTILQAVKDPRWFNPDLIVAVKGLQRTGVDWPELDQIIAGLQHGREKIGEANTVTESVTAYHGTFQPTIGQFHPLSHFGTLKAAQDRLQYKAGKDKIKDPARIYQVTLDIKNPLTIKDFPGVHYDRQYAFILRDKGLISQQEMEAITFIEDKKQLRQALLDKLQELGIDGFVYKNRYEDKGQTSYVIVDPRQVTDIKPVSQTTEDVAEDLTVTNEPATPAYIRFIEKKLQDNLRNIFPFVIELTHEQRMTDPVFNRQALAVFNNQKPEIIKYLLNYIKHSDSDNVKWLVQAMFKIGLLWPELKTIQQALAHGNQTESTNEDSLGDNQRAMQADEQIEHFLQALADGDNEYAMERLASITARIEEGEWPNRYNAKLLNPFKPQIVTALLQLVSGDYFDEDMELDFVPFVCDHFQEVGINWPELKTIQQALAHNKTESIEETQERNIFKNASRILDKDINYLNNVVIGLNHDPEINDPEFLKQCTILLEKYKPQIMKHLLDYISKADKFSIDEVRFLVPRLKRLGVKWPEFKIITRAINYGLKKKSVSEADDSEGFKMLSHILQRDYADNKVRGFWYMMYHLDDWNMTVHQFPEFDQIIAEIKPDIIKSLLKAVRADTDGEAIANVLHSIDRMHKCGVLWPELNQIKSGLEHNRETETLDENKYKQAEAETAARQVSAKLEKASKLLGNPSYDSHKMTFWEALWTISTIGPGYRQIFTPILDHYKPSIMLHILKLAKAGNTEAVERATEILNNTHIQWPELHTIHKALTHGKTEESVTENKYKQAEAEQYASLISSKLEQASKLQGNPNYDSHMSYFLEAMLKVGQTGPGYGQILTPILEHYKPVIIRHLLLLLKQNKQNKLSAVENILEIVSKIHIQWSELETIKKALAHGKQQTTETTDVVNIRMQTFVRKMQTAISNKLYWQVILILEDMARNISVGTLRVSDAQWQQSAAQLDLNAHKRQIIQGILENLKDSIQTNSSSNWLLTNMIAQKLILNKLGADWPELDTIVIGISNSRVNN